MFQEVSVGFAVVRRKVTLMFLSWRMKTLQSRIERLSGSAESESSAREILINSERLLNAQIQSQHDSQVLESEKGRECARLLEERIFETQKHEKDLSTLLVAKAIGSLSFIAQRAINELRAAAYRLRSSTVLLIIGVNTPNRESPRVVAESNGGHLDRQTSKTSPHVIWALHAGCAASALVLGYKATALGIVLTLLILPYVGGPTMGAVLAEIASCRSRGGSSWKRPILAAAVPLLMLLIGFQWANHSGELVHVTSRDGLMLLNQPSMNGSGLVATMPDGAEVRIVERNGDWAKVQYDGKTGWTLDSFLSRVAPSHGNGTTAVEAVILCNRYGVQINASNNSHESQKIRVHYSFTLDIDMINKSGGNHRDITRTATFETVIEPLASVRTQVYEADYSRNIFSPNAFHETNFRQCALVDLEAQSIGP